MNEALNAGFVELLSAVENLGGLLAMLSESHAHQAYIIKTLEERIAKLEKKA